MVYQDYDEEDLDFDNAAPVAVGQVGVAKARASTRLWHRRVGCGCCGCAGAGIPVICVVAVLLVAAIVSVSIAAVVTVRTNSDKNDDHSSSSSMAPTTSPTSTSSSAAWYDTWDKSLQWLQKGNDIGGIDSAPGNYGISVGMAGDGHMWAEGAHQAIGTDATSGHVRVFRYKAATEQWERFGKELLGDKHGDEYGYSLDLSRDGTHVAVGAPGADRAASGPDHGYFNVHRWNDTAQEWVQMGPDKWGEAANERSGHDIQINTRGNLVAIGAPGSPIEGPDTGEIRLFEYMPNTDRWLRRGNDIHGEAAGDRFGWSVAMNDDATDDSGLMIAGGAPYADANGADAGEVRVFMYNHTQHGRFHKVGHTMRGKAPGDNFGWSVAMNGEGTIVAVGAPGAADGRGQVLVYERNGNDFEVRNVLFPPDLQPGDVFRRIRGELPVGGFAVRPAHRSRRRAQRRHPEPRMARQPLHEALTDPRHLAEQPRLEHQQVPVVREHRRPPSVARSIGRSGPPRPAHPAGTTRRHQSLRLLISRSHAFTPRAHRSPRARSRS